jgi:hypothetical protein
LSDLAGQKRMGFALLLAAVASSGETPAGAEPKPLAAMSCRIEAGSGRLLCTVSLLPPPGRSIAWSDALVVGTPSAARALRSRGASTSEHPDRVVLAFVLGGGEGGRIAVVARAVACPVAPRAGTCTPFTSSVGFDFKPPA